MERDHVPAALARHVRERAHYRCEYCMLPQNFQEAEFHLDHIRPQVEGGKTVSNNLALACVTCSLRKGARISVKDSITGKWVRLFHPRNDKWSNHFEWDSTWIIIGKSPNGRATVDSLQLNDAKKLGLRRKFASIGLFP